MLSLENLYLQGNKIEKLVSTTFNIPGGKLDQIYLTSNICIGGTYNVTTLQNKLRSSC